MYTLAELLTKKEQILENFPFDKVHAYMLLTQWQWVDQNTDTYYSPTIDQLRQHAAMILDRVIYHKNPATCGGNGGFCCYKFEYGIKLSFEPFEKSSF